MVDDITQGASSAPYRDVAARAGYRAVQAEPLITKDGEFVGVLSVYFREPRSFSDRNRQLGGLVARLAADLIIGRIQQDKLSALNEALRLRTSELEIIRDRLSGQAADLLEQDRNREAFLATLGHELRNPMAAIKNSIEVLSVTDDKSLRAMEILKRQIAQMVRLINDMLDATRINRGLLRLNLVEIDLRECVLGAVESVRRQAETKGLVLHTEVPREKITIEGDAERLTQIFDNLLRNALNFTDRGSITVTVSKSAAATVVAIRDTGIGVEPSRIPSLFSSSRNDGNRNPGSGLGLGLSLVKSLVELHHGNILFRSSGLGLGSEVSVTFPLVATVAAPKQAAIDIELPSRHILVVDDNSDAADALAAVLESIGQEAIVTYSGETALEAAREHRPAVAFIDLTMPGMNGGEIAKRLRELFSSEELKLIALSGHSRSHISAEQAPFDDYLMKPADIENIIRLLSSL